MGWFDEQIRQRKENDQDVFEESIFRMASAVIGNQKAGLLRDERIITKEAIDDILKYYHYKPAEIPDSVKDPDEQLEYCLRPHGLMRRNVILEDGWYKDAYGPMLAFRKEDGIPVALLPNAFLGYWFRDPDSGERKSLNRQTSQQFDKDAICFYRPLPLKKLNIPDLILYMERCLSSGDFIFIAALSLLSVLVGLLIPSITQILSGPVLNSKSGTFLLGTAVFMISTIVSRKLIDIVRELTMSRLEIKTDLSVEAAMMMRLMNLPANFFRRFSSGELSSRFGSVNQLCSLLLGCVLSSGLTSLMSLLYITQITHFAPARC